MKAIYDQIGAGYSVTRRTDPSIARQLYAELQGASRILNIGAGTGSYEPAQTPLVAVEPSAQMLAQRPTASPPVAQAFAENLPFAADSFSHTMTVLSMHHWGDRAQAFQEINRVTRDRFVAITWDPAAKPFWLTRDYFPAIYENDRRIFPDLAELADFFTDVIVKPLQIPGHCEDGLLAAFWQRPEAYLTDQVRQATSAFAGLENLRAGLQKLAADLANGTWVSHNEAILKLPSLDVGYRLVSARIRKAAQSKRMRTYQ